MLFNKAVLILRYNLFDLSNKLYLKKEYLSYFFLLKKFIVHYIVHKISF